MTEFFKDPAFITQDPAYNEVSLMGRLSIVGLNTALAKEHDVQPLFDSEGIAHVKMDDVPVEVICAAGGLMKPVNSDDPEGLTRMDFANLAIEEGAFTMVAGAGHYGLMDGSLMRADVVVTNGSIGNSHTKAFKDPLPAPLYLVADTCFDDIEGGNASTLKHLCDTFENPAEHVKLFSPFFIGRGEGSIGTGTGAPTACVLIAASLRQQKGYGPLKATLRGFDGTSDFLPGVEEELPQEYLERMEADDVFVRVDGKVFKGQKTFLAQTCELIYAAHAYPDLIKSLEVDGPDSFNALIFNVEGLPRTDFEIAGPDGKFHSVFEQGNAARPAPRTYEV